MPSKHTRGRFEEILENIAKIRRYTEGEDRESFSENELVVDAVERCLSRISEAAYKLNEEGVETDTLAPGPRWKQIRGLGNVLRHGYDAVNLNTIWEIVTGDLNELEEASKKAIAALPPAQNGD